MKYYEDIVVGDTVIFPGRYQVTEENIVSIGQEWDPFPFHVDVEAAKESLFGNLVASTVHLFAITVKLGHSADNVIAAVSALGIDAMKNHAPAFPGDVLELHCTYLDKRPSNSRPQLAIMRSQGRLINQQGDVLFSYISSALIKMRGD